ncbi:MAG: S8 family serine peptidase, partial [Halorhabdus sp.]
MPVLFANVSQSALTQLDSRPDIRSVIRDRNVSLDPNLTTDLSATAKTASMSQTVPWGVERIDARTATTGIADDAKNEVTVAVIDTGIEYTHPDLDGSVTWGANFSQGASASGLSTATDENGHGTAVAGIIAAEDNDMGTVGVAPGVEVYAIKVLDSNGYGSLSNVVAGIDASLRGEDGTLGTDDDADVLTLSLGSSTGSDSLQAIVAEASDHAVVVSAAGNNGDGSVITNNVTYPAKYQSSIAVAATNRYDQTPTFSAEGDEVELAAPGVDVTTTWLGGGTASFSGTSAAAPHVAGTAALVIANDLGDGIRDLTPQEVRSRLQNTAVDIEVEGIDDTSGYGLIQADDAISGQNQPAAFEVVGIQDVTSVTKGEPLAVSAVVRNTGDEPGTKTVTLRIDGMTVADRSVTLDAGETKHVSFEDISTDTLEPGTHTYQVSSDGTTESGSFTVTAPPSFVISSVSLSSETVTKGDTVTLRPTIENTGGTGTRTVAVQLDGETVTTKSVTVNSGSSETVEFVLHT